MNTQAPKMSGHVECILMFHQNWQKKQANELSSFLLMEEPNSVGKHALALFIHSLTPFEKDMWIVPQAKNSAQQRYRRVNMTLLQKLLPRKDKQVHKSPFRAIETAMSISRAAVGIQKRKSLVWCGKGDIMNTFSIV